MNDEKQEIIIVRRGGDDHDGHHGGAWKIAFADFMTAMMALFLVLWLVNAANEETKKAVASYFNPVKLVDRNKSSRGLNDPGGVSQPVDEGDSQPSDPSAALDDSAGSGSATVTPRTFTDVEFFADPMTVLEILASQGLAEVAAEDGLADQLLGEALTDAETAIEFIDPFAPDNWTALNDEEAAVFDDPGDRQTTGPEIPEDAIIAEALSPAPETEAPTEIDQIETTALPDAAEQEQDRAAEIVEPEIEPAVASETAEDDSVASEANEPETMADGQEASVDALIADLSETLIEAGVPEAALSFEATGNRVEVSLADAAGFEMFGIGSAVPSPNAVRAIEALATAINQGGMRIGVEGHTDARPFQSAGSDNWKLSSDRALAAFYMLRRSGIPEDKFSTLEGRADRELAVPDDPFDSRNRRIELFLEPAT